MIEILYDNQEWRIWLPDESMYRDRPLVARRSDGSEAARWSAVGSELWEQRGESMTWLVSWSSVVGSCIDCGWTLHSLPAVIDDGQEK